MIFFVPLQTDGRPYDTWKGNFPSLLLDKESSNVSAIDTNNNMGKSCEQDSSNILDLKYYCVATREYDWSVKAMKNVWSVVPVTWLSSNNEFLVYPNPTYKAGGKLPCDWKPKIYKRHAHPQTSWLEYDIVAILNLDKPGN